MSSQPDSSLEEIIPTQDVNKELANGNVAGNWCYINAENYESIPKKALYTAVEQWDCHNKAIENAHKCLEELKWNKYKVNSKDKIYSVETKKESLRNAVIAIRKLEKLAECVETKKMPDYYKAVRDILDDFEIKRKQPKKEIEIPDWIEDKAEKKRVESKPKK